jgi:hypothetical protein
VKSLELRLLFGFAILLVITVLALIIALGKVQQDTSYGLEIVLGSLATLAGAFAQWAFSKSPEKKDGD